MTVSLHDDTTTSSRASSSRAGVLLKLVFVASVACAVHNLFVERACLKALSFATIELNIN